MGIICDGQREKKCIAVSATRVKLYARGVKWMGEGNIANLSR
jgi:hypothetical protein